MRADDQRFDVPDVDVAAGNGEGCEGSNVRRKARGRKPAERQCREVISGGLQRSEFFWRSLNSCGWEWHRQHGQSGGFRQSRQSKQPRAGLAGDQRQATHLGDAEDGLVRHRCSSAGGPGGRGEFVIHRRECRSFGRAVGQSVGLGRAARMGMEGWRFWSGEEGWMADGRGRCWSVRQ